MSFFPRNEIGITKQNISRVNVFSHLNCASAMLLQLSRFLSPGQLVTACNDKLPEHCLVHKHTQALNK